jgi:hypothetical protein
MSSRVIIAATLSVLAAITLLADPTPKRLEVLVTHFGYPGDPNPTKILGHLNPDSVAVSSDLDRIFPFGAVVYVGGDFIGYRDATLGPKFHRTIAVYDPNGDFEGDRHSYIEFPADKKSDLTKR